MEDNDKVEMKIVFSSSSHQTKPEKNREHNKLLTILQEQFASHWRKKPEAGASVEMGEGKYGKLLFLIVASLSPSFLRSANWIWIKHKQLEPMKWWFDFF